MSHYTNQKILVTIILVGWVSIMMMSGCATTKFVPEYTFPTPPAELMVVPKPLNQIPKKSGVVNTNGT